MSLLIHSEVRGSLGILTLARPEALNALSLEMAQAALAVLEAWRVSPRVGAVFLQGLGTKAFCAGGDVREIAARHRIEPTEDHARRYFEAEYRLDFALHTYPKPVLVFGHGFVLGGGLGMLLGGSVRIVTDSTRVAMPEIRIGLFPDVGASWFLSRLGVRGLWMALTACRVHAGDAIDLGLADVFVPESRLEALVEALAAADLRSADQVVGVVASFAAASGHRFLQSRAARLEALVASATTDVELLDLCASLADDGDPWLAEGARTLAAGSPVSARLIVEQLRRAARMRLDDVFRMDFDLAVQCVRRRDFHAGVGAVLIDKDGAPRWRHGSWRDVSEAEVLDHFEPVDAGRHPLHDLVGQGRHVQRHLPAGLPVARSS